MRSILKFTLQLVALPLAVNLSAQAQNEITAIPYKNLLIPVGVYTDESVKVIQDQSCIANLSCLFPEQNAAEKSRIIISSDVGGQDPDDEQSFLHYFAIADEFDIQGIISSPPDGNQNANIAGDDGGRVDDILDLIDRYAKDYPELSNNGRNENFPTPEFLQENTVQGAIHSSRSINIEDEMDGADLIIQKATEDVNTPLWVLVWGSATDVAKAIAKEPGITPLLRVYFIGADYNRNGDSNAANYIISQAKDNNLWLIDTLDKGFRGIYENMRGGSNAREIFIDSFIKPFGCIGQNFPQANQKGYKMGDTPSLLFALQESVTNGDRNDPTDSDNWGGSFRLVENTTRYWIGSNRYNSAISSNNVNSFLNHWNENAEKADRGCD